MTSQEAFEKMLDGLKSQKWVQSFDKDEEMCRYRSNCGLKCAVGHLVPDSEYTPNMEGAGVGKVSNMCKSLDEINIDLMAAMQRWHDSYLGHSEREGLDSFQISKLRKIAYEFRLSIPDRFLS